MKRIGTILVLLFVFSYVGMPLVKLACVIGIAFFGLDVMAGGRLAPLVRPLLRRCYRALRWGVRRLKS